MCTWTLRWRWRYLSGSLFSVSKSWFMVINIFPSPSFFNDSDHFMVWVNKSKRKKDETPKKIDDIKFPFFKAQDSLPVPLFFMTFFPLFRLHRVLELYFTKELLIPFTHLLFSHSMDKYSFVDFVDKVTQNIYFVIKQSDDWKQRNEHRQVWWQFTGSYFFPPSFLNFSSSSSFHQSKDHFLRRHSFVFVQLPSNASHGKENNEKIEKKDQRIGEAIIQMIDWIFFFFF